MASGDTLARFKPRDIEPDSAGGNATIDERNNHVVLDFDATVDEGATFSDVMPENYGGGDIEVDIHFFATSATSGSVVWAVAIERIADNGQDIDTNGFGTTIEGVGVTRATSGVKRVVTITLTNAEADSIAAGEEFRISVSRSPESTDDDMAGDAEVSKVHLREA